MKMSTKYLPKCLPNILVVKETFEDIKGLIRSRK